MSSTGSHRAACAAVRAWRCDGGSADDVVAVALREAGGDEDEARRLMGGAVEWWQRMLAYRDRNGQPITWRAA